MELRSGNQLHDEDQNLKTCWSCLVIVDPGAAVCPICGADQTLPEIKVVLEPEKPRNLALLVLRWLLVTVIVGYIVGSLLSYRHQRSRESSAALAQVTAAQTLHDICSALSAYALTSSDRYPATLASMGERVWLPIRKAQAAEYQIVYLPQPRDSDGSIPGFVILACVAKPGLRNFYIDESGVLRATQEDRPATAQDPPVEPAVSK
jgi:hypothetical protein